MPKLSATLLNSTPLPPDVDRATPSPVDEARRIGHEQKHDVDRATRSPVDELLTTPEVARVLRRSPRSLERDRVSGTGVPFLQIGGSVRYRASDVTAWLETRVRQSTSEAA